MFWISCIQTPNTILQMINLYKFIMFLKRDYWSAHKKSKKFDRNGYNCYFSCHKTIFSIEAKISRIIDRCFWWDCQFTYPRMQLKSHIYGANMLSFDSHITSLHKFYGYVISKIISSTITKTDTENLFFANSHTILFTLDSVYG